MGMTATIVEPLVLEGVEELRAAVAGKGNADKADIRYFLADAAKSGHDFEKIVAPFKDLHITVVLHNVGGSDLYPERYVSILSLCTPGLAAHQM